MGHSRFEGPEIWGNYLYINIERDFIEAELLSHIRNHSQYVTEFDEEDSTVFFVFKFTPVQKMNIVIPFLMGKYSEIDRKYVHEHFPMYSKKTNQISMNWRILHRDVWQIPHGVTPLKKYWEARMGEKIKEENAEVWYKPKMEHEIFITEDDAIREATNNTATDLYKSTDYMGTSSSTRY